MATSHWARRHLPSRPADANKGTFGRLLVFAGSADYTGAAYLACAGALRTGAGLVTLATPKSISPLIAKMLPEVTHLPLEEEAYGVVQGDAAAEQILAAAPKYDALLIGCGLGQHSQTATAIRKLLSSLRSSFSRRIVIDADALNILARTPSWPVKSPKGAILTPHPGEMSRLTGVSVQEIQKSRLDISRKMAGKWGKVVLLKGAYSVTASPDGSAVVNPFANPALATAGTGDVLAGIVAALLGQGVPPHKAAALGAYLHGVSGELVRAEVGDTGAIASDLLLRIPRAIKSLRG
jgi:NAD(P)H-hydrate epimerase